jgi:hypothetical protein
MVLDLSAVPDRAGPALLPAGNYGASVENVEYKRSQRSNNPMLEWRFRTAPQEGQERGNVLFWHTVLNHPNGLSNLKQAVTAIAPDIDLSQFHPVNDSPALLGRECKVRVRVRKTDDGTERNEVVSVSAPDLGDEGFLPS